MKKKIALIVNPVAGMGGSVGLKGTDGEMYKKALAMGAMPVTPARTEDMINHLKNKDRILWLTAPQIMGEDVLKELDIKAEVIGKIEATTDAEDTRRISREMQTAGTDLLVFVGGDGTARDILDALDSKLPVVAVPSGVKVFSAAFATSARAAAEMIDAFVDGCGVTEQEVLDIDEEAYRNNRLSAALYGYLLVPDVPAFLQPGKAASDVSLSSEENKKDIAVYVSEMLDDSTLYLMGPGTTIKAITDEMGLEKTLLGIDAYYAGKRVKEDLNEKDILALLDEYEQVKIIVTPIGGNGFIFGRGSKQFTPQVLRKVGKKNILVAANHDKALSLPCLRVDTGDSEVDEALSGYWEVIVGYNESRVMKAEC